MLNKLWKGYSINKVIKWVIFSITISISSQANSIIETNNIECRWTKWKIELTHIKQQHRTNHNSDINREVYDIINNKKTTREIQKEIYDIVSKIIDNWYEWLFANEWIDVNNQYNPKQLLKLLKVSYNPQLNRAFHLISNKENEIKYITKKLNILLNTYWDIQLKDLLILLEVNKKSDEYKLILYLIQYSDIQNINKPKILISDVIIQIKNSIQKIKKDFVNTIKKLPKNYLLWWMLFALAEKDKKNILWLEHEDFNKEIDKNNIKISNVCINEQSSICLEAKKQNVKYQNMREDLVLQALNKYSVQLNNSKFIISYWAAHDFSDNINKWNNSHNTKFCLNEITPKWIDQIRVTEASIK